MFSVCSTRHQMLYIITNLKVLWRRSSTSILITKIFFHWEEEECPWTRIFSSKNRFSDLLLCNFMQMYMNLCPIESMAKNKYLHVNIYTLIHYSSEMVMTNDVDDEGLCSYIRLTKPKPNISKVKYIRTIHRHRGILKCLAQFDRKHAHTRTHTPQRMEKGLKTICFWIYLHRKANVCYTRCMLHCYNHKLSTSAARI